ncbi:MAG: hypothetical protein RMN51_04990 [Verrucomicrobiota bacterium]|nr:hypothetical protein [Limisphaera sp.]MDW8381446.1 hypothetical protein [Verrucomicrobiota bacterium]
MRILLLGGSGNLSQACAEELRGQGHQVVLLTRGYKPVPPGFDHFAVDRRNREALRRLVLSQNAGGGDQPFGLRVGRCPTEL